MLLNFSFKLWDRIDKIADFKIPILIYDNQIELLITYRQILKLKEMGNIGFVEILLVLLVIVLIFGGRKIPELMKGIGQGIKEFKKGSKLEPENKEEKKQ